MAYTKIEVPKADNTVEDTEELNFEEVVTPEEEENELDIDDQVVDEDTTPEVVEETVKKDDGVKEKKRKERSQERIRQLVAERKERDAMIARLQEENQNLSKGLKESSKAVKTKTHETLAEKEERLTKDLKQAMEDGDTSLTVQTQNELYKVITERNLLAKELEAENAAAEAEAEKPVQQKQQQQAVEVPEQAQMWIQDHPRFNTDRVFHVNAIMFNNTLIEEGFDPNTEDFYEELDERMSKMFPDEFDKSSSNDVEYNNKDSSEISDDVKQEETSQEIPPQTVSGASRSPINQKGKKSARKDDTVRLSEEEIQTAKKMGLDLATYARNKVHLQKSKGQNGYTTINV